MNIIFQTLSHIFIPHIVLREQESKILHFTTKYQTLAAVMFTSSARFCLTTPKLTQCLKN